MFSKQTDINLINLQLPIESQDGIWQGCFHNNMDIDGTVIYLSVEYYVQHQT